MIEAPVEHELPERMSRESAAARRTTQRRLGRQQVAAELGALAVGVARHHRTAAPLQQLVAAAAVMEQQRLFLDLGLEREGAGPPGGGTPISTS